MNTTLLLDADIVAFKIASVSQKVYQFPDCEPTLVADEWHEVETRIHEAVRKITSFLDTQDVIVCLSCPTAENWRLGVLPTYKANRDYSKRPVHLAAVKDYMEANWPSYRRPTLEADDIMGILSTSRPGKNIIVSEDKDLKTVPGWLFNPAKDTKPRLITPEVADRWHMYQTIVGDATDNYAGCPGAGPDAALLCLDEFAAWTSWEYEFIRGKRKGERETRWGTFDAPDMAPWDRLVTLFARHGLTEEDALVQARVSRILRASDYDFNQRKVILWAPDSRPRPREARTA
jgi:DNA polymerase-1